MRAQALEEAGFVFYQHHGKGHFCRGLWQKAIRADECNLYFICLYEWMFPGQMHTSWSCECRMYTQTHAFGLELLLETPNVPEIEAFYSNAYKALGCVPDQLNND